MELERVSKCYAGGKWGLRDVTVRISSGILGLLGPNGAGKSTLMRVIASISRPTEGVVRWNGVDLAREPDAIRRVLGYLPQEFGVYGHLTAVEFLMYMAAAKGLVGRAARSRVEDLLEMLNLSDVAKRRLESYSGGMKQRVGIAQALLNDPQVLIADEPTVGLDPEERVRFRELISDLAGDRIIILSTHIVSDVEAVAARIAVLRDGVLITEAPADALLRQVEGRVWEWTIPDSDFSAVRKQYLISSAVRHGDGIRIRAVAGSVSGAEPAAPTLEDAYLYLVSAAQRGCDDERMGPALSACSG